MMATRFYGQVHWVVLGVGIVVLVAGALLSVWLVNQPVEPSLLVEHSQDKNPADESLSPKAGSVEESVASPRDSQPVGQKTISADDNAVVETGKEGFTKPHHTQSLVDDTGTVSDVVKINVRKAKPSSSGGGSGDEVTAQDSVELVVRDAFGKVKQRKVHK